VRPAGEGEPALWTVIPGKGNKGGTRISYDTLALIVRERGRKAGIDGLHPHVLRHTWASALYPVPNSEAMMELASWSGQIPKAYAAATRQKRAIMAGRQVQVSDLLRGDVGKR
jgi:integrase